MNEIFERNLKALEARDTDFGGLSKRLALAPSSTIEVEESRSGALTFIYKGIYFHSRYDPVKEALKLSEALKENGWDFTMIFGIGFGFLPCAIRKNRKGKILIFEPSIDILRGVFESVDLTDIIEDTDIFITDSLQEVSTIIRTQAFPVDVMGMHISVPYRKFFIEELRSFMEACTNAQTATRTNMNTLIKSSEDWFTNYLKNVLYFLKFPSIDILKDSFKGLPFFIVGAGPSLEKNARLLKKVKGRALIIAAVTAYKPLLNFGVVPDFVICMETDDLAEYFIGGESDREIRLMLGDVSHENMFTDRNVKGLFIFFSSFVGANKDINALFGSHFQPLSGGSVTTIALDIAVFMGASQVVFVGQDLAFGPEGSHVKGSVYGEQSLKIGEDGKVRLEFNYEHVAEILTRTVGHDIHWLDGVDGDKIMSRYDWVIFHQWIVDYVRSCTQLGKDVEMINSTEGGAFIEGMEHIALADTIEKYVEPLEGGNDTVEKIITIAENKPRDYDIEGLIAEFKKTLHSFKTVQSISEVSLKRIARIKKSYSKSKGLNECRKEILSFARDENKLTPLLDNTPFLSKAASKAAYGLQSHLRREQLPNPEEQFMIDMDATRCKNEAIVKLCRYFVPVFLNILKELQELKKPGGENL